MNFFLKSLLKTFVFLKEVFKQLIHAPSTKYSWSVEIPSSESLKDCEFVIGSQVVKILWMTDSFARVFGGKVTLDQDVEKLHVASPSRKKPSNYRIEKITVQPWTLCLFLKTAIERHEWFIMYVEKEGIVWEVSSIWTKHGWALDAEMVSNSPWMVDFSIVSINT